MEIYIVFEYAEHTNKIVGCHKNEEDAKRKHDESPTWRYVENRNCFEIGILRLFYRKDG